MVSKDKPQELGALQDDEKEDLNEQGALEDRQGVNRPPAPPTCFGVLQGESTPLEI